MTTDDTFRNQYMVFTISPLGTATLVTAVGMAEAESVDNGREVEESRGGARKDRAAAVWRTQANSSKNKAVELRERARCWNNNDVVLFLNADAVSGCAYSCTENPAKRTYLEKDLPRRKDLAGLWTGPP
eukprot:1330856-Rhodomonas_salina.1